MSEQWPLKPLGEICDVLDKLRKPITKKNRVYGEYPYYGATGIVDYVDGYIFDEKLVLIGEDGAKWGSGENTAFSVEGKCWVNNHAHVIRPNRNIVLDNWLIYFLNMSDLSEHITGLTVPKLNQGKLRAIQIPIPPLDEQHRIVSIIDEAFENISNSSKRAEHKLRNGKEMFQSVIANIFSQNGEVWKELKIQDVILPLTTVNPSKEPTKEIEYIDVSSVNRSTLSVEKTSIIIGSDAPSRARRLVRKDDVIFATVRPTLQRISVIPENLDGAICSTGYFVLRPTGEVLSRYLFYYLQGQRFSNEMESLQRGASYPAVSDKDVKEHIMLLPSLHEQKQIITILDSLSQNLGFLKENLGQELQNLDEFKRSILQEAFSGNLTGGITP